MKLDLGFVASATGGSILGPGSVVCDGASLDSRRIRQGQLFVALKGEKADGNDFVGEALTRAAAALVSRPAAAPKPLVVVPDTLRALQDLGREACLRMAPTVVAVTGSVGKSSAKELIHQALARVRTGVAASQGNLNSTIGVPLSVCNLPDGTRWAVLEMGISRRGEMRNLGRVAPPDVILFTGVHAVHTEYFDSLEAIAEEKAALAAFLKDGGAILWPAGDPLMEPRLKPLSCRKITFGERGDVDAEISLDRGFLGYEGALRLSGKRIPFRVPHAGLHARTLLEAAAVLHSLGLGPEPALEAAQGFVPLPGRLNLRRIPQDRMIVNDCYNASPFALTALLERFARTPVMGKKLLVLGDMLELGRLEAEAHAQAGREAASVVDRLITLGPRAAAAARTFAEHGKPAIACETLEAAAEAVLRHTSPGDWIALKASRAVALERLIPLLEDADAV
jgi:UDP-N-acetylmuramoyl-tripeptide--D-alanyl-D-alanine ligase